MFGKGAGRETVRRQVIHQFEQARIVDRNPDEPGLATNSSRTYYALSDIAIRTIRQFNTESWKTDLSEFLDVQESLVEMYEQKRQHGLIPLSYQGKEYHLSPGKHNELQVAIIEEFGSHFVPGARDQ